MVRKNWHERIIELFTKMSFKHILFVWLGMVIFFGFVFFFLSFFQNHGVIYRDGKRFRGNRLSFQRDPGQHAGRNKQDHLSGGPGPYDMVSVFTHLEYEIYQIFKILERAACYWVSSSETMN